MYLVSLGERGPYPKIVEPLHDRPDGSTAGKTEKSCCVHAVCDESTSEPSCTPQEGNRPAATRDMINST